MLDGLVDKYKNDPLVVEHLLIVGFCIAICVSHSFYHLLIDGFILAPAFGLIPEIILRLSHLYISETGSGALGRILGSMSDTISVSVPYRRRR